MLSFKLLHIFVLKYPKLRILEVTLKFEYSLATVLERPTNDDLEIEYPTFPTAPLSAVLELINIILQFLLFIINLSAILIMFIEETMLSSIVFNILSLEFTISFSSLFAAKLINIISR